MKLELGKNQDTFKGCVTLMTKLLEEACLVVNKDGTHVLAMDSAHVAMIDLHIKPELFEVYEVGEEGEKIFLNVKDLIKFLDRFGKDEAVTLETMNEKDKVPKLAIIGAKSKSRRRFNIDLLEPSEDEVPQPKIFFKSQAKIMTAALRKGIADANLVSEHIRLAADKDKFILSARGDMGSAESEWLKGSDDLLDIKAEEETTATYTMSYLNDLIPAVLDLAEQVTIEASTDMPLKISFDTGRIVCALYLAPCIGV